MSAAALENMNGAACGQAAAGARSSPGEPMLTLHSATDRRLGKVYAVKGRTGPYSHDLRTLGLCYRQISGAREQGGPGHRVPGVYVVPQRRYDSDEILQAELRLLFAQANGASLTRLAELQARRDALKRGGACQ